MAFTACLQKVVVMNGKELIRAVIRDGAGERLPFMVITMSFAARCIGKPYRQYATDHRVQVEGQVAFAGRFGADFVSVISDPAVEASDLGGGVIYYDNEPPANDDAKALLLDKGRLGSLSILDPGSGRRMSNRLEAVRGLVSRVGSDLMVEGWVEGPCAESADLRGLSRLMMDFYDDPDFVRELMAFVTEQEIRFALAQIQAGAEIIGVGDAASSLMGPEIFSDFTKEHHRAYVEAIHGAGALARLHICGQTADIMPLLADIPYDIIDLDTQSPISKARAALGPDRVLLGNIDTVSVVRDGKPADVLAGLQACYQDAGKCRYIVGAGCEAPGDSPDENILAMRDFARNQAVHEFL